MSITYKNDLNNIITYTEEEFRAEAKSMIAFAVNDKEYPVEDVSVDMIAEDITGVFGDHGLCANAMQIINEELYTFKRWNKIIE